MTDKRQISIVSMETNFLNFVHQLGPPEGRKATEPKKPEYKSVTKKGNMNGKKDGVELVLESRNL